MLSNAEICLKLPLTEHACLNIFTLSLCIYSLFYIQSGAYISAFEDGGVMKLNTYLILYMYGTLLIKCLPQADILKHNWYNCRPFNRNSALLYNFIEDNDLIVANFLFEQNVNFTYSNISNATYIDHILVPNYVMDLILKCDILKDDMSNMSDHYAVCILMDIPVYGAIDNGKEISRKFVKETHKPR